MTDVAILAPVLSSMVGLVSVLVAGLSVYFNYRGRHNQFRQVVYSKQMDAYFEIIADMANLYHAAQNLITFNGPLLQEDDQARQRFRTGLREEYEQFNAKVSRWLIVLPSKVKAALDHFSATLWAAGVPADEKPAGRFDSASGSRDPGAELALSYERAVNCIRHHLAVDSLTRGMLKEMGIGAESLSMRNLPITPLRPASIGRGAR
jgi:hypothetical protein